MEHLRPILVFKYESEFFNQRNSRISIASFSSRLIRRLVISLDTSSAALYLFRYLLSDFIPILHPSVIKSAILWSESLSASLTFT